MVDFRSVFSDFIFGFLGRPVRILKLLLFAAIGIAIGVGDASAADLPVKAYTSPVPAYSWTGLYVGGEAGLRSTSADPSVSSATLTTFGTPPINLLVSPSCDSPGLFGVNPGPCPPAGPSLDTAGFRVGPYVGYNWQFGPQWVAGVEEDWAWANQSKTVNGAFYPGGALGFIPGTPNASFSIQTTWDASIRGRVGYLVTPEILIYSTGGAAWMHVQASSTCPTGVGQACSPGAAVPAVITDSTTRLGWTIGGGIEAHLWGNWLVRGEYRYTDYGTWTNNDLRTFELAATTLAVADSLRLKTNTVMLGLAYHFGR